MSDQQSTEKTVGNSLTGSLAGSLTSGSIMSLLQNKTVIHIAVEVILFGAISFYFYRKTKMLEEQIKTLETKIKEQKDNKDQDFSLKVEEIVNTKMALVTNQIRQNFQEQHYMIQQRLAQIPVQEVVKPPVMKRAQTVQPTPSVVVVPITRQSVKTSTTMIEDTDELDSELKEELEELDNKAD